MVVDVVIGVAYVEVVKVDEGECKGDQGGSLDDGVDVLEGGDDRGGAGVDEGEGIGDQGGSLDGEVVEVVERPGGAGPDEDVSEDRRGAGLDEEARAGPEVDEVFLVTGPSAVPAGEPSRGKGFSPLPSGSLEQVTKPSVLV